MLSLHRPFTPCCPPLWAGASRAQGFHPSVTVPNEVTPPARACTLRARTLPTLVALGAHSYSPGDPSSSPDAACTRTQLAGGHAGAGGGRILLQHPPRCCSGPSMPSAGSALSSPAPPLVHIKFFAEEAAFAAVWIMRRSRLKQ